MQIEFTLGPFQPQQCRPLPVHVPSKRTIDHRNLKRRVVIVSPQLSSAFKQLGRSFEIAALHEELRIEKIGFVEIWVESKRMIELSDCLLMLPCKLKSHPAGGMCLGQFGVKRQRLCAHCQDALDRDVCMMQGMKQ